MEIDDEVSEEIVLPQTNTEADSDSSHITDDSDEDPEYAWEWRSVYEAANGTEWDLFCCPEDVQQSEYCTHTKSDHKVCRHCLVPICSDCYDHITCAPLYSAPMALANDNYIGYTYKTILKYRVRWIEAAAALPCWTTLMCYYIEGDQGHLLNEYMMESQYMPVVRGNVFSYHMDWPTILESLNRSTSDEQLSILPHHPDHLAHIVQLHLKVFAVY